MAYATSTPHRFFGCSDLRLIYGPSNELTEEYLTSSLCGLDAGGIGPRHQGIDVFDEVAVCETGEEVAQIGVRFNAVHFTSAYQAGKPGPVAAPFIVARKERIAAVHSRATDGVLHQVGIDIDAAVIKEQPKAILSFQHIGQGNAEIGLA